MTRLVPFRPRGDNWPCSCISMTFSLASGGAGGPTAAQGGEPCGDRASGGAAAAAAAAGGQRASSERDRTSIPGGGAEANSRQGRARHDNGNDGEAGTTKGHGGLIRPRPRGAQDEYSAVTTRHARALCSRVLKTRTRVASTVG